PGANTTYVRYAVVRAAAPTALSLRVLVNHRDYHSTTRGNGWQMGVTHVDHGVRVDAFDGAAPVLLLAAGAEATRAHEWYRGFALPRDAERGLDAQDDHLMPPPSAPRSRRGRRSRS